MLASPSPKSHRQKTTDPYQRLLHARHVLNLENPKVVGGRSVLDDLVPRLRFSLRRIAASKREYRVLAAGKQLHAPESQSNSYRYIPATAEQLPEYGPKPNQFVVRQHNRDSKHIYRQNIGLLQGDT